MLAKSLEYSVESANGLTFQVEPMRRFLNDGKELFALHRQEVGKDLDLMVLNIDEGYYTRGAEFGRLVVVGARHNGILVGYFLWSIAHHPHYKDVFCAQDDVHYLHPKHRRGLAGYFLLKAAIRALPRFGVQYCYVREKIGHEHPALMKRLGLQPLDITYSGKVAP